MYLYPGQAPNPEVGQTVASFLLRVGSLHAGMGVVFLLPQVSPSGDGADQTVVSVRVKVKGFPR